MTYTKSIKALHIIDHAALIHTTYRFVTEDELFIAESEEQRKEFVLDVNKITSEKSISVANTEGYENWENASSLFDIEDVYKQIKQQHEEKELEDHTRFFFEQLVDQELELENRGF
ncbi:hypothetical protein [Terribacillus saccharophilus]|uniref:hypothetical protein n=1 Tax=Terribacillus saccharophilus TaxID=361277 RepID=UPI002989F8AF|nr:hypothetical protein [Terribacillus saccharophilus]MCM3227497.1 hypothetical protein [Terribacillus saccharophilus]